MIRGRASLRAAVVVAASLMLMPGPAPAVVSLTATGRFVPVVVTKVGGPVILTNVDTDLHNLVSRATRPAGNAWFCHDYAVGRCPLFWSPLIWAGEAAVVEGLDDVRSGASYEFYCELHQNMTGTLHVL